MNAAQENAGRGIWTGRWIGIALTIHYILVCVIKIDQGRGDEIWWLCHATLALAAAGFMLRSGTLLGMAFLGVLVPHTLWLTDAAAGAVLGVQCAGVTTYLRHADAATWLSTCHHFYLLPLLWMHRKRLLCRPAETLFGMALVYLLLTAVSRLALPAQGNVNYAHAFFPALEWQPLNALNASPWWLYLAALNTAALGLFFLPAMVVLGVPSKTSPRRLGVPALSPSRG
ncbi:MAG: hypothetical protein Q9O74_00405 [Planctomycetota bacterium]|nr:hypothetical protein [Planctomycetota bacterium]